MTNRVKGLIVALEHDYREDDCENIINAIMMIHGVAAVDTEIDDSSDWINRQQVKAEVKDKILKLYKEI
jgi:hypothetical protein